MTCADTPGMMMDDGSASTMVSVVVYSTPHNSSPSCHLWLLPRGGIGRCTVGTDTQTCMTP